MKILVRVTVTKVVKPLVSALVKKTALDSVMVLAQGLVLEPVHPAAALVA